MMPVRKELFWSMPGYYYMFSFPWLRRNALLRAPGEVRLELMDLA